MQTRFPNGGGEPIELNGVYSLDGVTYISDGMAAPTEIMFLYVSDFWKLDFMETFNIIFMGCRSNAVPRKPYLTDNGLYKNYVHKAGATDPIQTSMSKIILSIPTNMDQSIDSSCSPLVLPC